MLTPKQIEDARKQLGINTQNPTAPTASTLPQRLQARREKEMGYVDRLKGAFQDRKEEVSDINSSNISFPEKILQNVGQIAGGASDIVTELPGVKQGLELAGKGIAKVPGVKQVAEKAGEVYNKLPERARDNIEAVGNIASLIPVGLGTKGSIVAGEKALATGAKATSKIKTGIGNALENTGQKIQSTVIKPSLRDVKDGFKIENVSKYDVGGDLPETIAKTHTKMNALSQELKSKLQATDSKADLKKVYADTVKDLGGDNALSFGDNNAIKRVIQNLDDEIAQVSEDGLVDLVRATDVKRGAGSKGAWAYNRPEADSSAIEKVYTAFYKNLKKEIETKAPEGVRDINKQISELIPINNAALRRMTIEERNNALSLMDNIGLVSAVFDPSALLLFGTNRALRSGKVGKALTGAGQKLKGTKYTSPKELPKPTTPKSGKSTYTKTIPKTEAKVNIKNPKAIPKETKAEMAEVIDYVRLKKSYDQELEEMLGKLAEKYGIASKSPLTVVNKFENLMTTTK